MKLSEQIGVSLLGQLAKKHPDRVYEGGTRWEGARGLGTPHSTITIRFYPIALDHGSAAREQLALPDPVALETFELPCQRHGRWCRTWREFLLADLVAVGEM